VSCFIAVDKRRHSRKASQEVSRCEHSTADHYKSSQAIGLDSSGGTVCLPHYHRRMYLPLQKPLKCPWGTVTTKTLVSVRVRELPVSSVCHSGGKLFRLALTVSSREFTPSGRAIKKKIFFKIYINGSGQYMKILDMGSKLMYNFVIMQFLSS